MYLEEPGAPSTRVFSWTEKSQLMLWAGFGASGTAHAEPLSNAYLEYLALITARYASCQMLKIIDFRPKRSLKVFEKRDNTINANNLFTTENQ